MAALHLPLLILSLLLCLVAGSPGEPTRRLAHLKAEAAPEWPEATRSGVYTKCALVGEASPTCGVFFWS